MDIYTIGIEDQLSLLRRKASPIQDITAETAQLAEHMVETMIAGKGIGLAGPQVGLLQRIFTVQIDEKPMVFINPQILATSPELSSYEEGCLSIPGQYADVKRPAQLQIQAWNAKGRPFTIEASGLLATVIQHEYDHLDGVLFIDHLSDRKRKKILGKFQVTPEGYPEAE
ncbi:MAG: peptide deformylase [Spirochaetales bacterium]|nr:peptide deformylase [Spirochaetales bacterium]